MRLHLMGWFVKGIAFLLIVKKEKGNTRKYRFIRLRIIKLGNN
ncbi:UNVERIFIED_ORG: hypothetical protein ABIC97_005047 [Peribacillus simplex]